uniref:LPXTG cell wall anchor domain-containing protein n=1 Tax=Listeria valentina TaxID=2705293 RepID=UPI00142F4EA3
DATDEELAPYIQDGGIPNQADLNFGNAGDTIHSEVPTVMPPTPENPETPNSPNHPNDPPKSIQPDSVQGTLPKTGDQMEWGWVLISGLLCLGILKYAWRRKEN